MTRLLALLALLPLAACGGPEAPATPATPAAPAPTAETPVPAAPPAVDGPAAEVTLTPVGNEMKYAETSFTAMPGQTVRLTFTNTADIEAMHHNVVVLYPGTDVDAFGQAAMAAADSDYIPPAKADRVVAHTAMSAPGETVTVEFTAPAAGTYTYICTFPGHYLSMRGTMTVADA